MLTPKAAALKYEKGSDKAPTIVAKGKGLLAQKIIERAGEYDIPLFKNELLADSLLEVDIDSTIPPALYKAVVEVFVWLANSDQKTREKRSAQ